jgi:rhodanese-related sulfurtransferase
MIREITKRQIDAKTAQGERVVLIEAQGGPGFELRHIPGALRMSPSEVRLIATQYLPDPAAEVVVYGADEHDSSVDDVAWQLSLLGYGNLYVYRGGKKDWFGQSGYGESVHQPPKPGERVRFDDDQERSASAFDLASGAE